MLSDKKLEPDLKQNPGVLLGKDEMIKFIDFVDAVTNKNDQSKQEEKVS